MYACGFNGFSQLSHRAVINIQLPEVIQDSAWDGKTEEKLEKHDVSWIDVSITWSNMILFTANGVSIRGLWDGERNFNLSSVPWSSQSECIRKAVCTDKLLLLLTDHGNIFKAGIDKPVLEWAKVISEQLDGKLESQELNFVDIATNQHSVLALDSFGVLHLPPVRLDVSDVRFKQIECGKEHFVALSNNGVVYTWGTGSRGQLGNGSLSDSSYPEPVVMLQGLTITQVAAGGWHNCAVSDCGDLYVWGWNESGQLGLPCRALNGKNDDKEDVVDYVSVQAEPRLLDCGEPFQSGTVRVMAVSCGTRHTAVVLEDRTGWAWGWNGHGQLGTGDLKSRNMPIKILDQVSRVLCGSWNTVWLEDGSK